MAFDDFAQGFLQGFGESGGVQKVSSWAGRNIAGGKYYNPYDDPEFMRDLQKAQQMGSEKGYRDFAQEYHKFMPQNEQGNYSPNKMANDFFDISQNIGGMDANTLKSAIINRAIQGRPYEDLMQTYNQNIQGDKLSPDVIGGLTPPEESWTKQMINDPYFQLADQSPLARNVLAEKYGENLVREFGDNVVQNQNLGSNVEEQALGILNNLLNNNQGFSQLELLSKGAKQLNDEEISYYQNAGYNVTELNEYPGYYIIGNQMPQEQQTQVDMTKLGPMLNSNNSFVKQMAWDKIKSSQQGQDLIDNATQYMNTAGGGRAGLQASRAYDSTEDFARDLISNMYAPQMEQQQQTEQKQYTMEEFMKYSPEEKLGVINNLLGYTNRNQEGNITGFDEQGIQRFMNNYPGLNPRGVLDYYMQNQRYFDNMMKEMNNKNTANGYNLGDWNITGGYDAYNGGKQLTDTQSGMLYYSVPNYETMELTPGPPVVQFEPDNAGGLIAKTVQVTGSGKYSQEINRKENLTDPQIFEQIVNTAEQNNIGKQDKDGNTYYTINGYNLYPNGREVPPEALQEDTNKGPGPIKQFLGNVWNNITEGPENQPQNKGDMSNTFDKAISDLEENYNNMNLDMTFDEFLAQTISKDKYREQLRNKYNFSDYLLDNFMKIYEAKKEG